MGIWNEILATFRSGSNLMKLIYINLAVFLSVTIIGIIGFLIVDQEILNQTSGSCLYRHHLIHSC